MRFSLQLRDRWSARTVFAIIPLLLAALVVAAYLPLHSSIYFQADPVADRSTDYRPLTDWTQVDAPFASHGISLALHFAASLVLLVLASRLGAGPFAAVVAALMFAMHPVHVETVSGVAGRTHLLSALFTLSALLAYTWADRKEHGPVLSRIMVWATAALLLLALLSREGAVVGFFLLIVFDLLFRGRFLERAAALAPSLLAVAIWLILRTTALEGLFVSVDPRPVDNFLVESGSPERLFITLGLAARYAKLLLFPMGLSADYSGTVLGGADGLHAVRPLIGFLILSGLLVLVIRPLFSRRGQAQPGRRMRAFVASLFLLPYLSMGNLLFPADAAFAERFLYLPCVAFCLAAGLILEHIATEYPAFRQWSAAQRFRYAAAAAVVLIAAFAFLTYARSSVRHDEEGVFRASSWKGGARSHFMLGAIEAERGNDEDALNHFRQATDSSPSFEEAWLQYGNALFRAGRLEEAEERLRYALLLEPRYREARLVLAQVLEGLDRVEEAGRENRKALVCPADIDSITRRRRLPPWR